MYVKAYNKDCADLCDECRKSLTDWFNHPEMDSNACSEPQPSEPRPIKSPMYRGSIDYKTGLVTVYRDDENGTLSYDEVKTWLLFDEEAENE